VTPLLFSLREAPNQRLDLSPLVPHRLNGKTAAEIAAIGLQSTRDFLCVGDVFHVRPGSVEHIRIVGSGERFDGIGQGMTSGEIVVEGDAGSRAGRLMRGGRLAITGNVGPWAGSGMTAGEIEIQGSAGERLGGPLAGEMAGMRGGIVLVHGDAGERAGDRMRRGTIMVEGRAGAYAGSRMIAGTVIVCGPAGPLPGYLMRRGTVILRHGSDALSPTFVDCGVHDLVMLRVLARFAQTYSAPAAEALRAPFRRFAGDMAVLGKGEILCPPR
jgi:formylmethanofuran dehydrogenase subunit C